MLAELKEFLFLPNLHRIFFSEKDTFKNLPEYITSKTGPNKFAGISMSFKGKDGEYDLTLAPKNKEGFEAVCRLFKKSKEAGLTPDDLFKEGQGNFYVISSFFNGPISATYHETSMLETEIKQIKETAKDFDSIMSKIKKAEDELKELEKEKAEAEIIAAKIYTKKEEAVEQIKDEEERKVAKEKLTAEKEETAVAQVQLKKIKSKITRRKKKRSDLLLEAAGIKEKVEQKEELKKKLELISKKGNESVFISERIKPITDVFKDDFLAEIRNDRNAKVTEAIRKFAADNNIGILNSEGTDDSITVITNTAGDTVKDAFFSSLFQFPSETPPEKSLFSSDAVSVYEAVEKKKEEIIFEKNRSKEYAERLEKELDCLKKENSGILKYYSVLNDIFPNNKGLYMGEMTDAGSLLLYLLGFSGIDPVKENLKFTGFNNRKISVTKEGLEMIRKHTGIREGYSLFQNISEPG